MTGEQEGVRAMCKQAINDGQMPKARGNVQSRHATLLIETVDAETAGRLSGKEPIEEGHITSLARPDEVWVCHRGHGRRRGSGRRRVQQGAGRAWTRSSKKYRESRPRRHTSRLICIFLTILCLCECLVNRHSYWYAPLCAGTTGVCFTYKEPAKKHRFQQSQSTRASM